MNKITYETEKYQSNSISPMQNVHINLSSHLNNFKPNAIRIFFRMVYKNFNS